MFTPKLRNDDVESWINTRTPGMLHTPAGNVASRVQTFTNIAISDKGAVPLGKFLFVCIFLEKHSHNNKIICNK